MSEGTFLTVEGIDGSGKSTVVKAIEEEYEDAVATAEPSELWTGEQVRKVLGNEMETDPFVDFFLFMADRAHHIDNTIKPALDDGKLVVSDRYADSTWAYQPQALEGRVKNPAAYIDSVMQPWNFDPDVTILIDIDIETSLERCDEDEKYEKREFLEAVRQNYEKRVQMDPGRFYRIDGTRDKEVVVDSAIHIVDKFV